MDRRVFILGLCAAVTGHVDDAAVRCMADLGWADDVFRRSRPHRGLVAHHKSGSAVVMAAHHAAWALLRQRCPRLANATRPSGFLAAPLPAAFGNETYEGWASPPRRVAHFLREPTDWVTSSYLYHRDGDVDSLDAAWLRRPLAACGDPSPELRHFEARWYSAMCATTSERGERGYAAYLRSLPVREGLAVEQAFLEATTFPAARRFLAAEYDAREVVCLEDLVASRESCASAWARVASALLPGVPGLGAHLAAATCAGDASHVESRVPFFFLSATPPRALTAGVP